MVDLNLRNLPNSVYNALCVRAAQHDNSIEAEARAILAAAIAELEDAEPYERRALRVRETVSVYLASSQNDGIVDEFIAERRKQAREELQLV